MKLSHAEALMNALVFFSVHGAPPRLKQAAEDTVGLAKERIEKDTKSETAESGITSSGRHIKKSNKPDGDLTASEEAAVLNYFNYALIKETREETSDLAVIEFNRNCSEAMQLAITCEHEHLKKFLNARFHTLGNNIAFIQFILLECITKVTSISDGRNPLLQNLKRLEWEKTLTILLRFATGGGTYIPLTTENTSVLEVVIDFYNSPRYDAISTTQQFRQDFNLVVVNLLQANIRYRTDWPRLPVKPDNYDYAFDKDIARTLYAFASVLTDKNPDSAIRNAFNIVFFLIQSIQLQQEEADQKMLTDAQDLIQKSNKEWHSIVNTLLIPVFKKICDANLAGVDQGELLPTAEGQAPRTIAQLSLEEYYHHVIKPRYGYFEEIRAKLIDYFQHDHFQDAYTLIAVVASFHDIAAATNDPQTYSKIDILYETASQRISKIPDIDLRNKLKRALFVLAVTAIVTGLLIGSYGLLATFALPFLLTNNVLTGVGTALPAVVGFITRIIYKKADSHKVFSSPIVNGLYTFHQSAKTKGKNKSFDQSHQRIDKVSILESAASSLIDHVTDSARKDPIPS